MKQWEYMMLSTWTVVDMAKLNELGVQGWELVGVAADGSKTIAFLKRELR